MVDEVASLDGVTELLLRVFGEVLGADDVSEDDDFFDDCGGSSLQAWWAIVEIADVLDVAVEFAEFVETRTARDTAAALFETVAAKAGR